MLRAESHLSLATVARACGWRSAGALCHAFRRSEGCTPMRWREGQAGRGS